MQDMQQESQNQSQFKDQDSFLSKLSFNRSIDRLSLKHSSKSLTAKRSIIEILDIDEPIRRKPSSCMSSQIDQESGSRRIRFSANNNKQLEQLYMEKQNYQMFDEIPNFIQNQNSYQRHQCQCSKQCCNEEGCPCVLAVNQLCVIGLCCSNCITKKNQYMLNGSGPFSSKIKEKKQRQNKQKRENNHIKAIKKANKAKIQKQKYDFVYCTCKKTQCMKKYCPCYAINKQCNQCCICQQCQNNSCQSQQQSPNEDRKNNKKVQELIKQQEKDEVQICGLSKQKIDQLMINEQIDNYFQDSPLDYDNVQLHKVMDFEPVDFGEYKNEWKH